MSKPWPWLDQSKSLCVWMKCVNVIYDDEWCFAHLPGNRRGSRRRWNNPTDSGMCINNKGLALPTLFVLSSRHDNVKLPFPTLVFWHITSIFPFYFAPDIYHTFGPPCCSPFPFNIGLNFTTSQIHFHCGAHFRIGCTIFS